MRLPCFFLALPLSLACSEGSLDPDSDLHEVYGTDDPSEADDGSDDDTSDDDDSTADDDDELTAEFFPSSACRMPDDAEEPTGDVPNGDVARPNYVDSTGFFVLDGRLYDKHGNDFVMRGLNNAHAWFDTSGRNLAIGALDDISEYGFNTVRIVWQTDERDPALTVTLLHQVIDCVVVQNMVPMVELHDVTGVPYTLAREIDTGDLVPRETVADDMGQLLEGYEQLPWDEGNAIANERLLDMARYYTREDVKQVLLEYEDYLLVNIANEWSGVEYYEGYRAAIEHLRDNGVNHTLVIDANGWGQNADVIVSDGAELLEADPQRNLLFSAHMYESFSDNARVTELLEAVTEQRLPFIVGEFGPEHGGEEIDVEFIFDESARLGTGYLAWSWKGNSGNVVQLDMAEDWEGETLTPWGQRLVDSPNGVKTAQRASVFLF